MNRNSNTLTETRTMKWSLDDLNDALQDAYSSFKNDLLSDSSFILQKHCSEPNYEHKFKKVRKECYNPIVALREINTIGKIKKSNDIIQDDRESCQELTCNYEPWKEIVFDNGKSPVRSVYESDKFTQNGNSIYPSKDSKEKCNILKFDISNTEFDLMVDDFCQELSASYPVHREKLQDIDNFAFPPFPAQYNVQSDFFLPDDTFNALMQNKLCSVTDSNNDEDSEELSRNKLQCQNSLCEKEVSIKLISCTENVELISSTSHRKLSRKVKKNSKFIDCPELSFIPS